MALAKDNSEALSRSIAEETIADLNNGKTMGELEIKEFLTKDSINEFNSEEFALNSSKERENKYKKHIDQLLTENNELKRHLEQMQKEVEKLNTKLKTESLLRQQAVNKLQEVLNRKDIIESKDKIKVSRADLRKKEIDLKKLQQELALEREKFVQASTTWKKSVQDLELELSEKCFAEQRLQMELNTKNSEIQISKSDDFNSDTMIEGWLSIPIKQNISKHGWRKQYVVVSNKKISFYNSESDKQNTDPVTVLDLCKVFLVRSVMHGDVIRADSKDIPRIFQILYPGEGEMRKTDEQSNMLNVSSIKGEDKPGAVMHKGHEFFQISYHMPTTCEVCSKPMWHMFKPPPAFECRKCRIKIHKEHLESNEDTCDFCKLYCYDTKNTKEIFLLAPSVLDQKNWIYMLHKIIQKSRCKGNNSNEINAANVASM